jgi:N-acetylmuramoyl-L-alanine amidase
MTAFQYTLRFSLLSFFLAVFVFAVDAQSAKKIKTIIIDPGHGGGQTGAHADYEGSMGTYEKNITLAIGLKVVDELQKQLPNTKVLPTRTSDITQYPKEKAKFANDNHGDLFVSIHADAVPLKTASRIIGYKRARVAHTTYKGKGKKKKAKTTYKIETVPVREYYKLPSSRKGTSTLIFAPWRADIKTKAMENSDLMFETEQNDSGVVINYDNAEWKAAALLYTQNYFKKSYKLGSLVQKEIADMGRENLGVWQREEGIWVLQATQMPAILIETGFITNHDDERYLNSEKGQQELAEAIAKAIIKYKDMVENPQAAKTDSTTISNK